MSDPERAQDGLDHLQLAALELVSAARAFLDVAEGLIKEPGAAAAMVKTVGSMAGSLGSVVDAVAGGVRRPPPAPDDADDPDGSDDRGDDDEGGSTVRHISVT